MTVRNLKDGSKKPWLAEVYPAGRDGPRNRSNLDGFINTGSAYFAHGLIL